MKSFESNFSEEGKKKERSKEKAYRKISKEILDSDEYGLNFEVSPSFQKVINETDLSSKEMQVYVLENFQKDQGALPGKLGERYASLVYSAEAISKKMQGDLDFYEAITSIAKGIEEKGIILDKVFVNDLVEIAKEALVSLEAA